MGKLLEVDFIRFGIVGVSGFTVTVIAKHIASKVFHLTTTPSIFFGSEIGLISNFILHERWTYKRINHKYKPIYRKFLHFQLSSLSGVLIITVIGSIMVKVIGKDTIFGLVIAASIAMFWNFFWTKYFIFRGKTPGILLNVEDTVFVEEKK